MAEDTLQDTLSTALTDTQSPGGSGAGAPPPETGDENLSIADVLRKEAAAQKEEVAKAEEKLPDKAEVKEEKPAPTKDAKAEKAEEPDEGDGEEVGIKKPDAGETETAKAAQSEGKADRIPSRLLPREREVWANVPNAVKAAWERMEREHAEASQKYAPAVKLHEELREYEAMAKQAGTSIKSALDRYVGLDRAIAQDFGKGLAQLVQQSGKNPVEAVAQLMRASGVLPSQLGAYLQGQPGQPQQQKPATQPDPVAQRALQEVAQLKQMLEQQQQESTIRKVEADIIGPHAAKHPRFAELQEPIAKLLSSGIIPASLSQVERLEVAQDMAERMYPAPVSTRSGLSEPAGNLASDAGKKSVRGAPSTGKSSDAEIDNVTDLRELLRKEAKRMG